jgi:diguanylate cyclase (GGDEF)-like protein
MRRLGPVPLGRAPKRMTMSLSAFGYASEVLLVAALAFGAYALGRMARSFASGDLLPNDALRRSLEALGVGVILVGRAADGRGARDPDVLGNDEARALLGLPGAAGRSPGPDTLPPTAPGWRGDPRLASALRGEGALAALLAEGEGKAEFFRGEGLERRRIEARAFPLGGPKRGTVIVLRDITANTALLEELSNLASLDSLTGAFNRRHFDELGARDIELARRSLASIGAIMLDIDLFKRVNDERGHPVGDEVLKIVTQACKEALRSSDILGRYGGEEFAVLLPGSGAEESLAVAERLRERVAAIALPCEDGQVSVTVSLGVYSGVPASDEDLALYMRRADEALYRSKALGRNKASYWQPL